jgi:hypothetical protein
MAQGCIVTAVNLIRVNKDGSINRGPSREIILRGKAGINGGAYITKDAVGTNSLRVEIRSWNPTTQDLYYQVIYTVARTGGANCTL